MVRTRSGVLTILVVAVMAACGDPASVSQGDGSTEPTTATTAMSGSSPTSLTSAPDSETEPSTVASTEPTEPSQVDDPPRSAEALARCSDVDQITTDVLSDPAQGNIDPIFHGVLLTYAAEHPDTFGGLWLDREAFGTVVLAFTDDPAAHRDALAQRRPSTDDVLAVEPPPEITDDRPIGEWGVAFDVVQVSHTEAELNAAIQPVMEAAQAVLGAPVSGGGSQLLLNRVGIDMATPVSQADLDVMSDAIDDLDGVDLDMICWSGQLVDETTDPIQPGTPLDAIRLPDDDGTYPPETPVTCDGLRFDLGDLDDLTPAADVEPGLASVLDNWLSNPEGQHWPQDDWALLFADDERAAFIQISADGVSVVNAEMGANGWIWSGAGGGGQCDVRLMLPPGVGEVEWVLDPEAPQPDASSTEIRILATERSCASGREMGDRLLGPQIVETDDAVRIAFGVIPQPGGQNCPSNPSTPVVVELSGPLGDRDILDGMVIGPITSLLDD